MLKDKPKDTDALAPIVAYNGFRPNTYIDWRRDEQTGDLTGAGFWIYDTGGPDFELIHYISDATGPHQCLNLGRYPTEIKAQWMAERFAFIAITERERATTPNPTGELVFTGALGLLFGVLLGAGAVLQWLGA